MSGKEVTCSTLRELRRAPCSRAQTLPQIEISSHLGHDSPAPAPLGEARAVRAGTGGPIGQVLEQLSGGVLFGHEQIVHDEVRAAGAASRRCTPEWTLAALLQSSAPARRITSSQDTPASDSSKVTTKNATTRRRYPACRHSGDFSMPTSARSRWASTAARKRSGTSAAILSRTDSNSAACLTATNARAAASGPELGTK